MPSLPKTLAMIVLSASTLFSSGLMADQKYGFAEKVKCIKPFMPLIINFKVDDYLDNFAGIAYNIMYIGADDNNGRADLNSLYTNSEGHNYLNQNGNVYRYAKTEIKDSYSYVNAPGGTMLSYLSKPVCLEKKDCQAYPRQWQPTEDRGLSSYDSIRRYYPNDFIYVHSGLFPTLHEGNLDTTIFTLVNRFKLLRIEIFTVTNGENVPVSNEWMHDIGAEPIVMEYSSSKWGDTGYYFGNAAVNRISRPLNSSPLKSFPDHLDTSIQAMDFQISMSKGAIGEIRAGAQFYYFSEAQKEILNKCSTPWIRGTK